MKKFFKIHNLSTMILLTVMVGMILLSIILTSVIIRISENIYVDTYGKSQEKVFEQIGQDLNDYHETLSGVLNAIETSWAFQLYMQAEKELDSKTNFQVLYQMKEDLAKTIPAKQNDFSVLIVTREGKEFLNRSETISASSDKILSGEVTKQARKNPNRIYYIYSDSGFTQSTQGIPVVMAVKAFQKKEEMTPYAYAFITMKESAVEKFYNYFVSPNTDFYMVDHTKQIVSSNRKKEIKQHFLYHIPEDKVKNLRQEMTIEGHPATMLHMALPYFQYDIYGVIDTESALSDSYDSTKIMLLCASVTVILMIIIFFILQQTMNPLLILTKKMKKIRNGNFDQYVEVRGASEVRELAITYNMMLDDVQKYVNQLVESQDKQRKA